MMVIKIVICHPIWRMSPLNLKLASLKCKMLCPLHYSLLQIDHYYTLHYSLLQIDHYYTLQCTLPHFTVHTSSLQNAQYLIPQCTVLYSTVHNSALQSAQYYIIQIPCTLLHSILWYSTVPTIAFYSGHFTVNINVLQSAN